MRTLLCLVGVCLLLAMPVVAQDTPRAEVFGGYSYLRFNPGGVSGINLNGWNASVTGNFNRWLGVTADFSGHYAKPSIFSISLDTKLHSFLFGPRFSYRKHDRVTLFAHALVGVARLSGSAPGVSADQNGFAAAFGGGVDIKVNDRFAVRLVQADYALTRFQDQSVACFLNPLLPPCPVPKTTTQSNVRLSFGIVLHLGKK